MHTFIARGIRFLALLLTPLLLLSACASRSKVDWNTRIGNYTYDQAVVDMGPPDKATQLSDGTTVAEWLQPPPKVGFSFGLGAGVSSGRTGVFGGPAVHTSGARQFLQLTFDQQGQLQTWKRHY